MGVRYASYSGGWRRNTLICHHDRPRAYDAEDLWERYRDRPLDAEEERALDAYLASREDNAGEFLRYFSRVDRDLAAFEQRHGIERRRWRRRAALFTNVAWDATRPDGCGPFADMYAWLVETVRHVAGHPDLLLLVKVHPGETRHIEPTPERWRVAEMLRAAVPRPPANVVVVGPDDDVSNHALYRSLDFGLVNTSSVGLEMALAGLPVLTTGAGAHYEGKGIVLTPADRGAYFATLDRLAAGREAFRPDREAARRYAHTLYFRKSIPFEPLDVDGWAAVGLALDALDELRPGVFPGLDALCRGILDDEPFELAPAGERFARGRG
jgi:hypothetical protein